MIKLENVNKSFGNRTIIKDLNLVINKDEITFIVGSSGTGKSTILNLIGGLDSVSSGSIIYHDDVDRDITLNLANYRAGNVGFIFQDYNLISGLSIKQNIQLGLLYSNKKESNEVIDQQLKALGLTNGKQVAETLSGGEKQRVTIARAVLKKADIILADEPTGNLDSVNAENVFKILRDIKKSRHVVVVSHDLEKARKYADRIITLQDGIVTADEAIIHQLENSVINDTDGFEKQASNNNKQGRNIKYFLESILIAGKNSVEKKLSRIFSIALVLAFAISALATVINLNIFGGQISDKVNINYLETDLISLYYNYTANTAIKELPFDSNQLDSIKTKYSGKEIVEIYYSDDTLSFSYQFLSQEAVIKQININDFFKERVMSNEVEGAFLQSDNEIILAKDISDLLFDGDALNKTITLNSGFGQSIELLVVGINSTVNPQDEIFSFVSARGLKVLRELQLKAQLTHPLIITKVFEERSGMTTGGIKPTLSTIDNNENIIYGHAPNDINEMILSHVQLIYLLETFGLNGDFSLEEIENGEVPLDVINALFSNKLGFVYNDFYQMNLVGIYLSDTHEAKFRQELFDEMVIAKPTTLDLYISDITKSTEIITVIKQNESFTAESNYENLKENISMQTRFFQIALFIIGIIMAIISISMLNSFGKINVLERKNEIGIIKSLGASNKNVLFLLWFDTIVISLLAIVFACWLSIAYMYIIPIILSEITYIKVAYPITLLLIIGFSFLGISIVVSMLNLWKLIKKMPAELIKHS
ncbi:MAG: ATP-binding cassette domain-containing protein [Christensenellaceae bacterium]|jgi:putative ABC transport system permease protein|nr:ATP-binding cassette domain-containing protein [Christensenellaceae bacterium]